MKLITSADELQYEGGYPTAGTIQKLYDQLGLQRAAQAYLDFIPAMSMQAVLDAHPRDYGVSETSGLIVYVEPGEGKSIVIGLTCNTESTYDHPDVNPDGSVDVFFGPRAPKGREKNWVKTLPGKGWFPYLRLYGPLEPCFDETWRPDDIVKA